MAFSLPDARACLRLALLASLALPAACGPGGSGVEPARAAPAARAAASEVSAAVTRASATERAPLPEAVRELYDALDAGLLERARSLLQALGATPAEELARRIGGARLAALEGAELEAARRIERARELAPAEPEVYATAAEIAAGGGRFESAWSEVRRGEERCGADAPELVRARGVLWITRPGGARQGLALLERARAAEPPPCFLGRALGQAHLVLARDALLRGDSQAALASIERSLEHDPRDVDARRLAADCRAAVGDLDGAASTLEELAREGVPLGAEVGLALKRAALMHLLRADREGALERFARARAAGLDDEGLGSGADLLAEEASRRIDRALERFRAGARDEALELLRSALVLEPDSLEAQNHLAVVAWSAGEGAEAVAAWRAVLRRAYEERLALPEPVHVHLARALLVLGERDEARAVLAEHLERAPDSAYAAQTRELLERLQKH